MAKFRFAARLNVPIQLPLAPHPACAQSAMLAPYRPLIHRYILCFLA